MKNKWLASTLTKVSHAASTYSVKVEKESPAGTFGVTKIVVAGLVGTAAAGAIGSSIFAFCGSGMDRGPIDNMATDALIYVLLLTLAAPLAGCASSPWISKVIANAARQVSDTTQKLSATFGDNEPPIIDFQKTRKSNVLAVTPLAKQTKNSDFKH